MTKINLKDKKVIIFDLDGTLAKSKADLDEEMSGLLAALLDSRYVVVMGGGNYVQFQNQFLKLLKASNDQLRNLLIAPVSGSSMYRYADGQWVPLYQKELTELEKNNIHEAFKRAFDELGYIQPAQIYGQVIEDRGSQITFSAAGQKAPLAVKQAWNQNNDIRPQLAQMLRKLLLEFEVRLGGLTSVDVTKKGIDKAFGVEQVADILRIAIDQMVYIGDALYEGGNDHAVVRTGISTIQIQDPEETKEIIRSII